MLHKNPFSLRTENIQAQARHDGVVGACPKIEDTERWVHVDSGALHCRATHQGLPP